MKAVKGIVSKVKASPEQEAFVLRLENTNHDSLTITCLEVAKECPNAIVMILSLDEADNSILVGVCCPNDDTPQKLDFKQWLTDSTKNVIFKKPVSETDIETKDPTEVVMNDLGTVMRIRYAKDSEYYAFKLVDQVASEAFRVLMKLDLYHEPEEEKEYGFDDI
jgi:uncharacterized protein YkuJ